MRTGAGGGAQTVFPTNTTTPRMSVSLLASTMRSGQRSSSARRNGWPSALVSTAATKGVLPGMVWAWLAFSRSRSPMPGVPGGRWARSAISP